MATGEPVSLEAFVQLTEEVERLKDRMQMVERTFPVAVATLAGVLRRLNGVKAAQLAIENELQRVTDAPPAERDIRRAWLTTALRSVQMSSSSS